MHSGRASRMHSGRASRRRAMIRTGSGGLRGAAAEGGIYGLYAYPGRFRLRHAEPFEDVQRLPEYDARRVRPLCAQRRFRDSFEDFGLLVGVTDLPGQPERGVVMIKCLAVPARSTTHVGYPAQRDYLLG